jgi:serine/threonine protein kinase
MSHPEERYEIIGTLGTGATSRVEKARDRVIGRTVALKTFRHAFGSGDLQKQFLREAQIIGALTHPAIVGLHDVGTNQELHPYLVMEYVDGKTLETMLDVGPLPLERAALWGADLAAALHYAHEAKIIHGDLKPANVLINRDGQLKLGDFGIARFATQVSASGKILGTPAYLSPEQILGNKQDTRSDLFSLGIILYEMTTGVRPFDGSSVGAVCAQIVSTEPVPPSQHNPSLPPAFDYVVLRCLAKDPAQRYRDAESLRSALLPFASRAAEAAQAAGSWWVRPLQRGDLRAIAAVLFVATVFGAAAGSARLRSSDHANRLSPSRNAAVAVSPAETTPEIARSVSAEPAMAPITVGAIDVGSSAANSPDGAVRMVSESTPNVSSIDASLEVAAAGKSATLTSPAPVPNTRAAQTRTPAAVRRSVLSSKSRGAVSAAESEADTLSALPTAIPASTLMVLAPAPQQLREPAPAPQASLHVEIAAAASNEIVSVFDGDTVLLATTLQNIRGGDGLRFDYSVPAGHHVLRVAVARPGEQPWLERNSPADLRADASNTLTIHVTRRAKHLLLHETALEVTWPSAREPLAAGVSTAPAGALAMR